VLVAQHTRIASARASHESNMPRLLSHYVCTICSMFHICTNSKKMFPYWMERAIAIKVPVSFEIARAWHPSALDVSIVDRDVAATVTSTQNIVVSALFCGGTSDVAHENVFDDDPVCRVTSRAAIQIVLLDVDTINGDVLDTQVLKENVLDQAGGVLIGLDARTILGV